MLAFEATWNNLLDQIEQKGWACDKGSVVVSLLLAWLILQEAITFPKMIGGICIAVGLLIIARG